MLRFLLISLIAWFVISRLLRLKVLVYKGEQPRGGFNGPYSNEYKKEGTLRVDSDPRKPNGTKGSKEGDYVDYEEV